MSYATIDVVVSAVDSSTWFAPSCFSDTSLKSSLSSSKKCVRPVVHGATFTLLPCTPFFPSTAEPDLSSACPAAYFCVLPWSRTEYTSDGKLGNGCKACIKERVQIGMLFHFKQFGYTPSGLAVTVVVVVEKACHFSIHQGRPLCHSCKSSTFAR